MRAVASAAAPLLVAQAEAGFPGVGEESLEALLLSKKKTVAGDAKSDDHRRTDLVLAAISAIKPDLTEKEASACVARGFLHDIPDAYADLYVPPDMLGEVLVPGEAQAVEKYATQVAAAHAEREHIISTRDKRVLKYFKKVPAAAVSAAQKRGPRWLPAKDAASTEKITKWMLKWVPPGGGIDVDDYNGRWRALYPPTNQWKSLSWTKRGYEAAACEAIWWTWTFHYEFTKEAAPFDMEELARRFREAAVA